MALNSTGIASGVAGLSVTGVTIKNLTNVPNIVTAGECPVLIPDPDNWIGGGFGEPGDGPATFGPGLWNFERVFGWLYLHAATGQRRGMSDHLADISANIDAITTALTGLDVSGVDVAGIDCSGFGEYRDQSQNSFYGCRIAVTFKERINA